MRALLVAAAFLVATTAAQGASMCGDRDKILESLRDKYGEQIVAYAVNENGYVFELLTTPGGETFTLIATRPTGQTCLMATGRDWTPVEPEPLGDDT